MSFIKKKIPNYQLNDPLKNIVSKCNFSLELSIITRNIFLVEMREKYKTTYWKSQSTSYRSLMKITTMEEVTIREKKNQIVLIKI